VHIHIANDALLVDDEKGTLAVTFRAQHAILLCHRAMRPEVTQQRVSDSAKILRPCLQAGHTVNADSQYLGV
jgi:hypothetical protein